MTVQPPAWIRHAIWWQVYPLGFTGAPRSLDEAAQHGDPTPAHRLPAITAQLDHLLSLGANGLLLNPIFAARSHGYDTLDHFRIDPRLGDEADFEELVTTCHAKGVKVVLDGVFNHVAAGHPLAADPAHLRGSDFEGHGDLLELDLTHPVVADYVVDVCVHWLDRGVDGWRLDAAYAVPASTWRPILDRIRERFPDAWLLGEMIHGDYTAFVEESGLHSVTQYELWKAIWSSLSSHNFYELAWSLGRHEEFVKAFLPLTFIGNHDVTRIASQLPGELLEPAIALLALLPGVPSMYYGDEYGYRGIKEERFGGDDEIRPAFPAPVSSDLVPADSATILSTTQRYMSVRRQHPWLVDARTEVVELANEHLVLDLLERQGAQRLRATLDIGDQTLSTITVR